jgi:hypothetical protein
MKEEVYERANTLNNSINKTLTEVHSLRQVPYICFKQIQIGDCTLSTNEELSQQIIDTIIAYKERQIEQWKQEFEKL